MIADSLQPLMELGRGSMSNDEDDGHDSPVWPLWA
jgi:hypothetical protein